jgi:hypothetical protein
MRFLNCQQIKVVEDYDRITSFSFVLGKKKCNFMIVIFQILQQVEPINCIALS